MTVIARYDMNDKSGHAGDVLGLVMRAYSHMFTKEGIHSFNQESRTCLSSVYLHLRIWLKTDPYTILNMICPNCARIFYMMATSQTKHLTSITGIPKI